MFRTGIGKMDSTFNERNYKVTWQKVWTQRCEQLRPLMQSIYHLALASAILVDMTHCRLEKNLLLCHDQENMLILPQF